MDVFPTEFSDNEFSDIESEDRNLEPEERLVKKYFSFLISEYGFTYHNYYFTSENLQIQFWLGHKTPTILIVRVGEPEFTKIILDRIIQYFAGSLPGENIDFTAKPLEQNLRFFSIFFRKYATRIIDEINDWWLPVQVFQFRMMESKYKNTGHIEDFLGSYKREFDYLKSKGVI